MPTVDDILFIAVFITITGAGLITLTSVGLLARLLQHLYRAHEYAIIGFIIGAGLFIGGIALYIAMT